MGLLPVESIIAGDSVVGLDGETAFTVYERTADIADEEIVVFRVKERVLKVTAIHPMVVLRNRTIACIQAGDVSARDKLFVDGQWVRASVSREKYSGHVYNLLLWPNGYQPTDSKQLMARTLQAEGFATADLAVQAFLGSD